MKIVLFIIIIVCISCKDGAIPPLVEVITLEYNKPKTFLDRNEEVVINVDNVQDSRCPVGAVCVRAGEVIIDLSINGNKKKLCIGCSANFEIPQTIDFGGHSYKLLEVTPVPDISKPHTEKDIVVKIQVD